MSARASAMISATIPSILFSGRSSRDRERSAGVHRPRPFPAGAGALGVLTVTPANPYPAQKQYKPPRAVLTRRCRVGDWQAPRRPNAQPSVSPKLRKPALPGSRQARPREDSSGSALPPVGRDEFKVVRDRREVGPRLIRLAKRQNVFVRMSGPSWIHPEIDCHCTDQSWASSSLRSGRALGAASPEPPLFPAEAGPAPT